MGLVAHHTGARYEAEERGLAAERALPEPSASNLDLMTFVDLSVGPDGTLTTPGSASRRFGVATTPGILYIEP